MTQVYDESFLKFWGNFFLRQIIFFEKFLLVLSTTSTTSSFATGLASARLRGIHPLKILKMVDVQGGNSSRKRTG
jgi:hypothetical protein